MPPGSEPPLPPVYLQPPESTIRNSLKVPAVAVRIKDFDTGERIERDVIGWVRDGEFAEPMELRIPPDPKGNELVLCGGFERPGTYEVEVRRPRYAPWIATVTVEATEWGWPRTEELFVDLQFEGISGTWEIFINDSSRGELFIYETRLSLHMEYRTSTDYEPTVHILSSDGEQYRFGWATGDTYTYDLIHVPPDYLAGTVNIWGSGGNLGTYPAYAIRTGPPRPR